MIGGIVTPKSSIDFKASSETFVGTFGFCGKGNLRLVGRNGNIVVILSRVSRLLSRGNLRRFLWLRRPISEHGNARHGKKGK